MKKLALTFILVIFSSTACFAADMGLTLFEFRSAYNKLAPTMKMQPMPNNPQKSQKVDGSMLNTYALSDNIVITLTLNKNDKIEAAIYAGSGNGTQQSGAEIILTLMNTYAALTPELSGEQRSVGLKALGIIPAEISDGKQRKWTKGKKSFSSEIVKGIGVVFTADTVK